MNNDLISREALIKSIQEKFNHFDFDSDYNEGLRDGYLNSIYEIEDAPAVEETVMVDKSNFSKEQYNADLQTAYDCGYERGKNERQKGEWIDTGSGQECNVCHEIQYGYDNFRHFCANCGAKMKGGAE